ncbi:uncharacterized protein [Aegilops tauschii subsp. strangulata]|nr:uncharacterized protein LOC109736994 isoform X1 [Aegilops tauschii subsp. strangulata]XP_045086598.1 uncharacterized protein LOC109736994 isoform X1 [Aegilops tauschii subsp. strangulata]XP_045086599.1 uncharacterized protein LOC109736994 isoform X1 [Aegilops tauschii subsp. strangulata]XP_045086600.1 uncharacterized protein LOC109736994 isoform X1 [Aegilops tauschii subsp. strangulata]XP_045086601.1 uncharacterized protein LOC109736994 isoform X1 [Aegilops tauschii subsp. strangulata]XP_04
MEKDCFQIAFVIFVMGYLIAPCTKYDSMTIDFWGALANPELIAQFNWCEYGIQKLLAAVSKVQSDYQSKAATVHLFACHFFFQLRPADQVCYTRPDVRSQGFIDADVTSASGRYPNVEVSVRMKQRTPELVVPATTTRADSLGDARSAYHSLGPRDFANHLRRSCHGDPVLEELSLMLKQQNAKCTLSMSLLRSRMQADMLSFADRIVSLVRDRCRCCEKRGRSKCISLNWSDKSSEDAQGIEQKALWTVARRLEMSDEEDLKMGSPEHLDAAPVYDNPVVDNQVMEERNPTLDIIGLYAQVIVDTVRSLYDTAEEEPNVVYFGNMEATLPKRKYAMSASFARSPWLSGCLPQPPPISLVNKFSTWISRDNDSDLDSLWFEHKFPRMLRVNAVCVKQQFFGAHPLDHEVAVLALRRFNQLDVEAQAVSKYLLWREVLEPDFSTHALAGEKVAHIKAVQLQIAHAHHDITACQTFYTPVILDHGWAAYMWDMIRKEIHILDPLCAQPVGAEKRHATHQEAVSQIHEALFSCLNEFFARWHCTSDRWKRKSPKITREVFTRDESGMCMLHAIRHYDGEKMTWPLTKRNLDTFRQTTVFEVFRLQDEQGNFVADHVLRAALEEDEE